MNITSISPIKFNFFNKNINSNTKNTATPIVNKDKSSFCYPINYYLGYNQLSFGNNKETFEKMKSAKSEKELHELFAELTQTVQDNVRTTADKFSQEGLTFDSYLPACVKEPSLFTLSPDTIEKNVRDLVERFSDDGLTVESYLPTCVKQPSLFVQFPDTIKKCQIFS